MKILIAIFLVAIVPVHVYGQKDNLVRDELLYNDLYDFLITRVTDYLVGRSGKKKPSTELYVKGEHMITTRNLRTDSIIPDKKIVGLYATRFACMDCGSHSELYFQYIDRREYLTIDPANLKPFELINTIELFFESHPNEFTEIEKIRTLKGALQVLEARYTRPWNDW